MFRTWCAFALGCVALMAAAGVADAQTPPPLTPAPLDRAKVSAFVDGAVREALKTDHIAGVSVAIVDRSGVVMTKGYGAAALSPRRDADADTVFRVGSISKTGVWISLMQLVQAGKVGLDDPINAHLPPDLQIADQGFKTPIRVRDLMNHSAGFEDSIMQNFIIRDQNRLVPLAAFLRTHRLHRVREPGLVSAYSNYGAILASAIVTHVSGQLWEDYAEQHVFRPLGMNVTTYRQPYPLTLAARLGLPAPMPTATAARLADSFLYSGGALQPKGFEYVNGGEPVGALSASANDMARYMQALLDPAVMQQAGVLNADTVLAMRAGLPVKAPQVAIWRHGFMDFSPALGRPAFGHGGDLIYQHAMMIIDPDDGLAIFVAVNTPSGIPLLNTLPLNLLNTFAGPLPAAPKRVADAKAEAAKVVGQYEGLRRPAFRTERAFMRLLGASKVTSIGDGDILVGGERFYPIGHGQFQRTDDPGRIAFAETGGRMRLYDSDATNPSDRVGFFASGEWLQQIAMLGLFVAAWGGLSFWLKLGRKDEPGRRAGLVLDGLCLVWFGAFALVAVALAPALSDQGALVFDYPGKLLQVGLWTLALAAAATPVAAVAAFGPWRPSGWSWWRWSKQGVAVIILLSLAVTLLDWGFLGFSGWK
jgi:CubicO group peptidase (beta-lactamase class C family)